MPARNLPSTTCQSRTGMVTSSSSVPPPFSSAMRRMAMAGMMKLKSSGRMLKYPRISAWRSMKSEPKNRYPANSMNTVTTMYAMGELK